jgi:PhnB protein
MIKLNPYLNFNGTADKAIQLYQRALGAKLETIMRFGDVKDMPVVPETKDRVMHAMLQIDEGILMISDCPPGEPVQPGNNVTVTLHFDDVGDMAKKFDAMAVGGTVQQPLQDMFWGARFGMLTDAYGIPWMFNCETKNA